MSMLAAFSLLVLANQEPKPLSLFDGKSLAGWHLDVPELDANPDGTKPFIARDGNLVSLGAPTGHLITDVSYENYRLVIEYRFSKEAGNCGAIVHCSTPRFLANLLPKGIEVQMKTGNAGDFHLFGETLKQQGATAETTARRLQNYTDNSEKPAGEWNSMIIECAGDLIKVWVNKDLVNHGISSSAKKGQIALQSEGSEVEFRKVELTKLASG
jgi:hypothetical protein